MGGVVFAQTGDPASSNANLLSINLSGGAQLAPAFASNVVDYTVSVDSEASSLTVTAIAAETSALIAYASEPGSFVSLRRISLEAGKTRIITITVTAEDRTTRKIYTLTVTREVDYDDDDNGLISVATLAQLDAMRWDLDGNGTPTDVLRYAAAFPFPATGMGCPSSGCMGYELDGDLDFDTDENGAVNADDGELSWGAGEGWLPIAGFAAVFEGDGHVISNLFISRGSMSDVGLFGSVADGGRIEGLGLVAAAVAGQNRVGALAGITAGQS